MATPGVTQLGFIWSENCTLADFTQTNAPLEVSLESQYQFCNGIKGTSGPSTPNYESMSGGSFNGNPSSDGHDFGYTTSCNIFQQLQTAGFSWKTYEEGVLYTAVGNQADRHCPGNFYTFSVNKKATATTPAGTNNVRSDFSGTAGLLADINNKNLPDFFWISPNDVHTAHNTAPNPHLFDVWLNGGNATEYPGSFPGLNPLLNAMRPNSILIIGDDAHRAANPVITYYCILCKPPPNPAPPTHTGLHTHLDVLYSVQNYFGLPKFTTTQTPQPIGGLDSRYLALTPANLVPFPTPGGTSTTPTASVAPNSITFPNTQPGNVSASSSATISNTGTANLIIPSGGIALTGTNPGKFAITSGAATSQVTLAPGTNQVVNVTFNPGAADAPGTVFHANLQFTDNDGGVTGSTQTIPLTGTVDVVPSPPTGDFIAVGNLVNTGATNARSKMISDAMNAHAAAVVGNGSLSRDPSPSVQFTHVDGTGSEDTAQGSELGRVDAIRQIGNTIFIGGNFNRCIRKAGTTVTRNFLCAIDATTLELINSWDPDLDARVYDIQATPDGNVLVVGDFTQVKASSASPIQANHVALFSSDTSAVTVMTSVLDSTNNGPCRVNASVETAAVDAAGGAVFIGGQFASVGGNTRNNLAKLNIGTPWTLDTTFTAGTDGIIHDSCISGNNIIIGGNYGNTHTSGGGNVANPQVWSFNKNTGANGTFIPDSRVNYAVANAAQVLSLCTDGTRVYITCGAIASGDDALAYDLSGNFLWAAGTDGNVQVSTPVGSNLLVGHHGTWVTSTAQTTFPLHAAPVGSPSINRQGHGYFKGSDGSLITTWGGPPGFGSVSGQSVLKTWAMATSPDARTIYIGGDFTQVSTTSGTSNIKRFTVYQSSGTVTQPGFTYGAFTALGDNQYNFGYYADEIANFDGVAGGYAQYNSIARPIPGDIDYEQISAMPLWQANHAFTLGATVGANLYLPTNLGAPSSSQPAEVILQLTQAGTTGGTQPNWRATAFGGTVTDGTAKWKMVQPGKDYFQYNSERKAAGAYAAVTGVDGVAATRPSSSVEVTNFPTVAATSGAGGEEYYAWNFNAQDGTKWRCYALNTNLEFSRSGGPQISTTSAQYAWLQADITAFRTANPSTPVMAYLHHPVWSTIDGVTDAAGLLAVWQLLLGHGCRLVLSAHANAYQRMKALDSNGNVVATPNNVLPTNAAVMFCVGTGGHQLAGAPNTGTTTYTSRLDSNANGVNGKALFNTFYGALHLTLTNTSFTWQAVAGADSTGTAITYSTTSIFDSGTYTLGTTSSKPPSPTLTTTPAATTTSTTANFVWTDSDPSVTQYKFSIDGGAFSGLSAGTSTSFSSLSVGPHTFQVIGNNGTDSDPTSFSWTINPTGVTNVTISVLAPAGSAAQANPPSVASGSGSVSYLPATVSGSGVATVTVTGAPSGTQAGDTIIAHVSAVGSVNQIANSVGGMTRVNATDAADGSTVRAALFFLQSTNGDAGTTFTFTCSGATGMHVVLSSARGAFSISPVAVKNSTAADNGPTPPTVTTALNNAEVSCFISTTSGPVPYADAGCLFGMMPNASFGGIIDGTDITRLEGATLLNRRISVGHSDYPYLLGTFPETSGTKGVFDDFNKNRLSFISWPSQNSWHSTFGTATASSNEPAVRTNVLQDIQNGLHDADILANAQKLKTWGHPVWFRLMWEMNGGDPPWSIGGDGVLANNPNAWLTAFIGAWKRIYVITKGTRAQATNLGIPTTQTIASAANVYFHYNPQEFETDITTYNGTIGRDQIYPGDAFVDFCGTELYLSPGNTMTQMITNTSFQGATHNAINAFYLVGKSKIGGNGEGGDRWQGTGDNSAAVTRVNSFLTAIQNFPLWRMFVYWDGGTTGNLGQSAIQGQPAGVITAIQNWVQDPIMNPVLQNTFASVPTGWSALYQARRSVGATGTNYGAGMIGTTMVHQTQSAAGLTASPNIHSAGYGRWATITIALNPALVSSTTVSAPTATATETAFVPNVSIPNSITVSVLNPAFAVQVEKDPIVVKSGVAGTVAAVPGIAAASAGVPMVSPPPAPSITDSPVSGTTSTSASFSFASDPAAFQYFARVDSGTFVQTNSPVTYTNLAVGPHTFNVFAKDTLGVSSAITSFSWTIQPNGANTQPTTVWTYYYPMFASIEDVPTDTSYAGWGDTFALPGSGSTQVIGSGDGGEAVPDPIPVVQEQTQVGITGTKWTINGTFTNLGTTAEGMLLGQKAPTAIFDDLNSTTVGNWRYPDGSAYNATRNANELIAQIPSYASRGVNALEVSLCGGTPTGNGVAVPNPQPWDMMAFNTDGSRAIGDIRSNFWTRLALVIEALDRVGMVCILNVLYNGNVTTLTNDAAVQNACQETVKWLCKTGLWKNTIVNAINETDHSLTFSASLNTNPGRIALLNSMRATAAGLGCTLYVGMGYSTNANAPTGIIGASDWTGFSNLSSPASSITSRVAAIRGAAAYQTKPIPIIVLADNNLEISGSTGSDRLDTCLSLGVSPVIAINGSAGSFGGGDYVTGWEAVPAPWGVLNGQGGVTGTPDATKLLWDNWLATKVPQTQVGGNTSHTFDAANGSIASDYYPGDFYSSNPPSYFPNLYSSVNQQAVNQQFRLMQAAGVDVVAISWAPPPNRRDAMVPTVLAAALQVTSETPSKPIRVAFMIEPYAASTNGARSVASLTTWTSYILSNYGSHPNMYRTLRPGLGGFTPTVAVPTLLLAKPLIQYTGGPAAAAANPGGSTHGFWASWVTAAHPNVEILVGNDVTHAQAAFDNFDGCFSYLNLPNNQDGTVKQDVYQAMRVFQVSAPPNGTFITGVAPGYSALRIQEPYNRQEPRQSGAFYDGQWQLAMNGTSPGSIATDIAVTTWNQWQEGTQVEPIAASGVTDTLWGTFNSAGAYTGPPYQYLDYENLAVDGYLTKTATNATTFSGKNSPESYATVTKVNCDLGTGPTVANRPMNVEDGLYQIDNQDFLTITPQTKVSTVLGRTARAALTSGNTTRNQYFDVENIWRYQVAGSASLTVSVTYLDSGFNGTTDKLVLVYDGQGGTVIHATQPVLGNSNTWKTQTWALTDAYFGGRLLTLNGYSLGDFAVRGPDKDLWLDQTSVTATGTVSSDTTYFYLLNPANPTNVQSRLTQTFVQAGAGTVTSINRPSATEIYSNSPPPGGTTFRASFEQTSSGNHPATSEWLYQAPHFTGVMWGSGPTGGRIPSIETFSNRKMWITDFGGTGAPFNPTGKNAAGNQVETVYQDWTTIQSNNSSVIPEQNGTGFAGHAMDPIPNILGIRSADATWPGHAAIAAWTYGDGSYVDQCVTAWANIMLAVQRRTLVRMWHEMGNGVYNSTSNWPLFISNWRKVCIRLRNLGALAPDKCQVIWCPASHPTNPSDDSDKFPGTYPSQPGGTDWIGRDEYIDNLSTWENAGQAWYDSFNPINGPLNTDKVPLIICESGIDSADPQRITKLNHLFDLLKTTWSGISAWTWWDGAGNDLIDTPAGFQAAWRAGLADAYFLPNAILPATGFSEFDVAVVGNTLTAQSGVSFDGSWSLHKKGVGTAESVYVQKNLSAQQKYNYRFYFNLKTVPSATTQIFTFNHAAGNIPQIRINTTGQIVASISDDVNATLSTTLANTLALNTWYRIEGAVDYLSASQGTMSASLYVGNSTTALTSGTTTMTVAQGYTQGNVDNIKVGNPQANATTGEWNIDAVGINPASSGPVGP